MYIKTITYDKNTAEKIKSADYGTNWPIVYLLLNRKRRELYVGETVNARRRLKQHFSRRNDLDEANLIIDERFNKSATLDIESWLIQYFSADSKFKLQNGNKGIKNHNYYDRETYRAIFDNIWDELRTRGLATQDLIQLKNSDLFKFSPYQSLNDEQIKIVDDIQNDLENKTYKTYVVNGEAGTGKSVLATYLIKYVLSQENTNDLKVALVVPMSGLRKTLKKVFKNVSGLKSNMVIGPSEVVKDNYDLLIVDETHRLKRRVNLGQQYKSYDDINKKLNLRKESTQLDWILKKSKSQLFLYDSSQQVGPGDIRNEDINKLNAENHKLTSQLRVQGGNDYIQFIENLLIGQPTPLPKIRNKYNLKYFDNPSEMIDEIKNLNQKHGLCRVVAGYAWEWKTSKGGTYDIELDGLKLVWNSVTTDWVNSPNAINEVGCIHTIQGYDLNYVGVIIGPELKYNPLKKLIYVDVLSYKDINGKRGIADSHELQYYIKNIYKTLLSRGINGTFIHAVDKNLANYIKDLIND